MVSFVATNGEPTTTATSKLVWWNLVEQMTMTPTSCTSAATLPTRTRAPPSRALYKSGSIIVLGKTDFLRPDMDPITRWTATKKSGLISYKKLLFHGLDLWTALSLPQPLGRAALWPPHRTIHQHLQLSSSSKRWSFPWSGSKMLGKHHLQQLAATPPPPHHGSYKNTLSR
ncbi:hypothetical protein ZEAMMB73_Zm00001d034157 [Zea mays]|uniref:Uncharacterized protein n=1 Tax=Zea mays TaxID=4577 RepID=A0A1D6L5T0_MAIZE|nr:hypothetical protein ZEAMMB73_Zm00001d034157 [Zea mays]